MGEMAELLLDGSCCEICGTEIGAPVGYPRTCSGCGGYEPINKQKAKLIMNKEIEDLKKLGYKVEKFTDYHYRINNALDIWPSKKKFHFIPDDIRDTYTKLITLALEWLGTPGSAPLYKIHKEQNKGLNPLRDQIAIAAMQGLLSNHKYAETIDSNDYDDYNNRIVYHSFTIADLMLEAMKSKTQEDNLDK